MVFLYQVSVFTRNITAFAAFAAFAGFGSRRASRRSVHNVVLQIHNVVTGY
jgi:hypothetical protein